MTLCKNINIYCVLKTSETYNLNYVNKLHECIKKNTPKNISINFVCLTDNPAATDFWPFHHEYQSGASRKLKYNWPGWWSKMELFRPDIEGDILFFDLDTIIYNNLQDIYDMCFNNSLPIMIAPFQAANDYNNIYDDTFYQKYNLYLRNIGSGVMWLPKKIRKKVWEKWMQNPHHWMEKCKESGDQHFISYCLSKQGEILFFQKLKKQSVVSFKIDCIGKPPKDAMVICYHGTPRPHETGWATKHSECSGINEDAIPK